MSILRRGVLDGAGVALAAAEPDPLARHLRDLGARVAVLEPPLAGDEEAVGQWAADHASLDAVVVDTRGAYGRGGHSGLQRALDAAWASVREVATDLIAGPRPGKIVLVAPGPDAGPLAGAARAGLENLARTLAVEWARHGITTTAILPGPGTAPAELAEVVAYLLSPAGAYFSGCRLELGAATARPAG